MTLKLRLALLFSISVFFILTISAISIYYFNENFRKEEYYKRLVLEANENNRTFISDTGLSKTTIAALNENALNSLVKENIIIIDTQFTPIYKSHGSTLPFISMESFAKARKERIFSLPPDMNEHEGVVLYEHDIKPHYLIITALDLFGYSKSNNLKILLIASAISGILLSGFLAFIYVTQALKPLENLRMQIENITEANLEERVVVKGQNELTQIGQQFNAMLDRLENAFEHRKNFVQHASHELRTPLAIMLSQTEAALNRPMTEQSYRLVLESLQEDQQDLIELINSLLTLSRYEQLHEIKELSPVRIDDVLFQCIDFVNQVWKEAIITVDFNEMPENENLLVIQGNETLIKSALQNLIKNAIQYSDNQKVKILIAVNQDRIQLLFENQGKTLSKDEQLKLFIPFFRGENSLHKKGYGLGLSIVETIIKLHSGAITYHSIGNNINRFSLYLPKN